MIITYIYKNEKYAREVFEELKNNWYRNMRKCVWSDHSKIVELTDVAYRFIHHSDLKESYRGFRSQELRFEPAVIESMTLEQLNIARLSLRTEQNSHPFLDLEEVLDEYRKRL